MPSALKTMELTYGRGLGAAFAGTAVGFGASVALGTLYGKYREKWYGQWMPAIFAVLGKGVALATYALSKGHWHTTAVLLSDVGQAGVNALGLDLGVKAGLKWAGQELVVQPKGGKLGPGQTKIAGDLPPAQEGRSLDEISVEDLANLR